MKNVEYYRVKIGLKSVVRNHLRANHPCRGHPVPIPTYPLSQSNRLLPPLNDPAQCVTFLLLYIHIWVFLFAFQFGPNTVTAEPLIRTVNGFSKITVGFF